MPKRIPAGCMLIALVFAGVCTQTNLAAMPPHPELLEKMHRQGDRAGLARVQALKNEEARLGVNRVANPAPAAGNFRLLVVLMEFQDQHFSPGADAAFYSRLLNGDASFPLSMKKYYSDMSGSKFTLTVDVRGPYMAANGKASYDQNGSSQFVRAVALAREAVNRAEIDGVNFALYDNNSDGYVDTVMVIHSGPGGEVSGSKSDIWSHAWALSGDGGPMLSADGKIINVYGMQPEYVRKAGDSSIGVLCHEFGHILGLSDMYDTTYETDGAGMFSIMGSGAWAGPDRDGSRPAPFLAWEKHQLGWINARYPDGQLVSLNALLPSALAFSLSAAAGRDAAALPPLACAIFALGLFGLGGGCLLYRSGDGRTLPLAAGVLLLCAAAFCAVSCGGVIASPDGNTSSAPGGASSSVSAEVSSSAASVNDASSSVSAEVSSSVASVNDASSSASAEVSSSAASVNDASSSALAGVSSSAASVNDASSSALAGTSSSADSVNDASSSASAEVSSSAASVNDASSSALAGTSSSADSVSAVSSSALTEVSSSAASVNDASSSASAEVSSSAASVSAASSSVSAGASSSAASVSAASSSVPAGASSSAVPGVQLALGDIEVSRTALVLPLGDPENKQFYFIENKVIKAGTWTEYLPGGGLLIVHIHNGVIDAMRTANKINDGAARIHGVNIVEADGANDLWQYSASSNNAGTAEDLFHSRSFTPYTSPPTFYYTGASPAWLKANTELSQVYIEDISAPGSTMTLRYSVR